MLNLKQNLPFAVPSELLEFIGQHIQRDGLSVINFRDSSYHPSEGGFRPVEIMVEKLGNDIAIHYYTEFRYYGVGTYAELGKSNDFDLAHGEYFNDVQGVMPIDGSLEELFALFVKNTLSYSKLDLLDELEVSFMGGHLLLHKNSEDA